MIKCSANYCKADNNFVITGIVAKKEEIQYIKAIKIVKNIINRGIPTRMSQYLNKIYRYNLDEDFVQLKLVDLDETKIDMQNNKEKIELIQIIRLQFVILELLKNGYIDFKNKWKFEVVGISKQIAITAIEDIRLWLEEVLKLQKADVKLPLYYINENDKDNIVIDIDVFKTYEAIIKNDNVIYVRNDISKNTNNNYYELESDISITYSLSYKNKEDEKSLRFFLKNIFGFDDFRDGQLQIIINVLNRRDTIGILPTSTGKSLCYQLAALLQPGLSIVVCPIKALLKDQKDNLNNMYIKNVAKIDSSLEGNEKTKIVSEIKKGKYQFVLVAPERFQNQEFKESLMEINEKYKISYGVIDEVHCMSDWGHDFRVSYLQLVKTMRKYIPNISLIGLTATVAGNVLKDLRIEFNINDESDVINPTSFIRPELKVEVFNCIDEADRTFYFNKIINKLHLTENIFETNGKDTKAGIVFTAFVKRNRGCIKIAKELSKRYRTNIQRYHGNKNDLTEQEKEEIQNGFKNNEIAWLCATKSFGMGIDKPNIRYIIHYAMPPSIEALYQEMGRAGRDGKQAWCKVLHVIPQYTDEQKEVLFKANATNKEIYNALGNDWEMGDVLDHFMLDKENKDPEEITNIVNRWESIKRNSRFKISDIRDFELDKVQRQLYKLSLLGLVNTDWTVSYNFGLKRTIEGSINCLDKKEIENNIENHIKKYDPKFNLQELNGKEYKSLLEIVNNKKISDIERYVSIICTWYNENILYSKRMAIRNVDRLLSSFISGKDCTESFNKKIEDYFSPDDYNYLYRILLAEKIDYIALIKRISSNRREWMLEKSEKTISIIARLKESIRNNPGLNLIEGIVNIYLNKEVVKEELEYALQEILKQEECLEIYTEILKVASFMEEDEKEELNKYLLSYFNSLKDLIQNYKYLKTESVLQLVLKMTKERLDRIERGVINGFGKDE